jgi:hypothetical protein
VSGNILKEGDNDKNQKKKIIISKIKICQKCEFKIITGFQSGFPRPAFGTGSFFSGKDVDKLYSRITQRETISGLISSYELASKYIEETSDIYLARGHLAAKADFIYGSQV